MDYGFEVILSFRLAYTFAVSDRNSIPVRLDVNKDVERRFLF